MVANVIKRIPSWSTDFKRVHTYIPLLKELPHSELLNEIGLNIFLYFSLAFLSLITSTDLATASVYKYLIFKSAQTYNYTLSECLIITTNSMTSDIHSNLEC